MNISIFGLGYVGCISLGCLARDGHTVTGVDINSRKVAQINNGLPTIIEKDIDHIIREAHAVGRISATMDFEKAVHTTNISIVAVGTPSGETGHLNLTNLFSVAENIGKALRNKTDFHTIAIRSTVMPGTAEKFAAIIATCSGKEADIDFAIVANPEFLREGSAVYDYYHPPITLLGSVNATAIEQVACLYKVLPAEIVIADIRVVELMKYVNNTYHALKISFANEIGNICSALQVDAHQVMDIFCMDKVLNISTCYFKPGFAYGGSCLPKDLKGLQTLAHDLYVQAPLISSIDKTNEIQIQRTIQLIINEKRRKLGFLGLSFKAGTDDFRNSPAVAVIETLLGKGYDIAIYDPNIQLSKLTGTNKEYIDAHIPHLSALMVDDPKEILLNSDLLVVNNKEKVYAEIISEWDPGKPLIDLIRLDKYISVKAQHNIINQVV